MKKIRFTIPLSPATKKNSPTVIHGKGGQHIVLPSNFFLKYQRDCRILRLLNIPKIEQPVNIKAIFYVPDTIRRDLTNLEEALADIFVYYEILGDDNFKIVKSWDGSRVFIDRVNPRTEVEITFYK